MLKLLRKKKILKRILWGLVILIVPAFVLMGAGSAIRSKRQGPSYVGKIYGRKVSFEKFAKSYEACYHQVMISSGGDPERLKQLKASTKITEMAWNRLLMLAAAKRQRIKVTDKEVIDAIAGSPFFKRGGIFDKTLYDHVLTNFFRIPPRKFEEETRENLIISNLRNKILQSISINDKELLAEYKKRNEKIKISYLLVDPEDFEKNIQLNAGELRAFYEENIEAFRKGDEVSIKYLFIKDGDGELIHKVTEEINVNKPFGKIAEGNGLEIEETTFFSIDEEIPGIGWSYEIIKAAFTLKEGMISFPIYTPKGYYIIALKEKRNGYIPSFEEIEPSIKKQLIKTKSTVLAKESASGIYKDINKTLGRGGTFGEAARKTGLKIEKTKLFSRRDYIEGIGLGEALKEAAFGFSVGAINPPVSCEKGFAILIVDEIVPPDDSKFKEEKQALKESLLIQKKFGTLKDWLDKLTKNAELKVDLDLLSP